MKILIVYYSLYGHIFKLAQAVKEGAESVKGAEVLFRRVEEFDIVLKKTADDKYLSQVRDAKRHPGLHARRPERRRRCAHWLTDPLRQYDRADEAAHRFDRKPLAQRRDGR